MWQAGVRDSTGALSIPVFSLICRTSSKKVIYSQPAARSEVSKPPGRWVPPGGLSAEGACRGLTCVFLSPQGEFRQTSSFLV